ncbi:MAG: transporter [Microbacteriaceae bacterium]|jgi:methionine-rich copper-binding protein CopC|nr:transporter [Microbacteriaceae bacterium]
MAARRTAGAALLGLAITAFAVVGAAAPAQAHDTLVASTPAQGQVLTALPDAFSVTLNESLVVEDDLAGNFGIQVTDAAGRYYGDGCLSFVDATMSMPATLGAAGDYTMVWQALSADSHPVGKGLEVRFTWAPPGGFDAGEGSVTPPVCGESAAQTGTAAPTRPEPSMTTQAEAPTATATPPTDGDTAVSSTVFWIGGAALAIIVAVGATLLFVRPGKPADESADELESAKGAEPAGGAESAEPTEGVEPPS